MTLKVISGVDYFVRPKLLISFQSVVYFTTWYVESIRLATRWRDKLASYRPTILWMNCNITNVSLN